MAQIVKNLPAIQETQVRSLGRKDPLEKGMVTHSNILAWRIPWTEEPGRLQGTVHGVTKSWTRLSRLMLSHFQRLERKGGRLIRLEDMDHV